MNVMSGPRGGALGGASIFAESETRGAYRGCAYKKAFN